MPAVSKTLGWPSPREAEELAGKAYSSTLKGKLLDHAVPRSIVFPFPLPSHCRSGGDPVARRKTRVPPRLLEFSPLFNVMAMRLDVFFQISREGSGRNFYVIERSCAELSPRGRGEE